MPSRRILVTAALPYANGQIHIGHLVEYLQTDIWVRFQKLRGNNCKYFCADDTHGTAIMIRARQEGRSEEELIADVQRQHEEDFAAFGIEFDNYGSTNSAENRELCNEIWAAIRQAGLVKEADVQQLFDPEAGAFLADRFVRGECPKCGAADQPGDNCSSCGTTYTPAELKHPKSTLSGATPEVRNAEHLFIELEQLHGFLEEWTQSGDSLQPEIANYLKGHFLQAKDEDGQRIPLRDWDISRPAPYFGFEIPDSPGNYWYVWFDAPIGYIASTQQWCDKHDEKLDDWWKSDDCEVHHFIGKDITYFHTLFWPGMLKTAGYSLPTKVHIHGFLTVNGEKMSKSKGTFITARSYVNHLDPSYLRYFYASKLSSRVDDIDLSLEEFIAKVDTDLVGKFVNLASRSAKFVAQTGLAKEYPDDGGLFAAAAAAGEEIAAAYESCDYSRATRLIMSLADKANPYVEEQKPWELRKDESQAQRLQDVCTVALNLFRQIAVYLAPVLPDVARQAGELLNDPITDWAQSQHPLLGTPVGKFKHMMNRVDERKVAAMIEENKTPDDENAQQDAESVIADNEGDLDASAERTAIFVKPGEEGDQWNDSGQPLADEPLADECSFDDFMKVDLRVARVVSAEHVEEARKLLKLKLSLGGGEYRQVFAGIKAAYDPEKLVGRLVVMVANLAPRKMKFGLSEGMVVASGPGGEEVFVLSPDDGAKAGQRVH
ncbi:Methionine--tRNA ligase [Posidoniimonas polymericola]|uniref:Methionine--tRNA ligase n=1 Tax=Posidoniimonas polymericola TaxID=2528002 RepID=A0A5C5YFX6_9BACT|nr:methionine--tRNA ligase [Posidoniimonas polymericola]TWT73743.1 Methionine--tRNA ligase [Posidoniimonas polymericola]